MAATGPVLLDTGVLVHLVRDDPTGRVVGERWRLAARPADTLYCLVSAGELRGLARLWRWGPAKLAALDGLLRELVPVDISGSAVLETYARLYAEAMTGGHPRGENDLWIAATAVAARAALITCDRDFDWLHPNSLTVHYVATVR